MNQRGRTMRGIGAGCIALTAGALTTGLVASGCSSSSGAGAPAMDYSQALLQRMQTCEALTQALRADASSKMNRRIDAEIQAVLQGYGTGFGPVPGEYNAGGAAGGGSTASGPQAPSAPAHSDTETQVKGVDEADIVKADGTRLYVLHGQKLFIVNAWPAPSLAR